MSISIDGRPGRYSLKYHLIYTWRRWTWQLRSFPEVRGMGYNRYRKTYLRQWGTVIIKEKS
jgi:hypothetical protein